MEHAQEEAETKVGEEVEKREVVVPFRLNEEVLLAIISLAIISGAR